MLDTALDAEAAKRVMDNPLYWVFSWESGQVLADYLLDYPELVRGQRVLDFGSGSGVVALAAALAGAREVIACDCDPLARRAIAHNAALNGVRLESCEDFADYTGDLDLILAADVLYDRDNLPWLDRFAARAPAVLVADSRLRDFSAPGYSRVLQRECTTVPDVGESREFNQVSLYACGAPVVAG
jgi:predicted nicotinamide N-methyase